MTITSFEATQLATSYHEAMNMVSQNSAFHCTKSPRKTLETYLHWSKVTGVVLHNDAWESHAEKVVEHLTQKRIQAWKKITKGG